MEQYYNETFRPSLFGNEKIENKERKLNTPLVVYLFSFLRKPGAVLRLLTMAMAAFELIPNNLLWGKDVFKSFIQFVTNQK